MKRKDKSEISSQNYVVFYDALLKKFIEFIYPDGIIPFGRSNQSPEIWDDSHPKTKEVYFETIFGTHLTTDKKYFYRLKIEADSNIEADKNTSHTVLVNSRLLCIALEFLKFYSSEIDAQTDAEYKVKASYLLGLFFNSNGIKAAPDLKSQEMISIAKNMVETFFNYIANGYLDAAWDMLSEKCIQVIEWKGKIDDFRNHYSKHKNNITELHIFNFDVYSPTHVNFMVYYRAKDGLIELQAAHNEGDYNCFFAGFECLKRQVENNGGTFNEDLVEEVLKAPTTRDLWLSLSKNGDPVFKSLYDKNDVFHAEVLLFGMCMVTRKNKVWEIYILRTISRAYDRGYFFYE